MKHYTHEVTVNCPRRLQDGTTCEADVEATVNVYPATPDTREEPGTPEEFEHILPDACPQGHVFNEEECAHLAASAEGKVIDSVSDDYMMQRHPDDDHWADPDGGYN